MYFSTLNPLSRSLFFYLIFSSAAIAANLSETITHVKASVVGIGTYSSIRGIQASYSGTGFVVADGLHVVTNAHVLPEKIDTERNEYIGVFVGINPKLYQAKIVSVDSIHDLALLKINGPTLPHFSLGSMQKVKEGMHIAFTGFPIGPVLGLYPVTHRGIISAIVPIATAGRSTRDLNPQRIQQLNHKPFMVFQLDATAYPGNSGSPLYDPSTGKVLGVINMVFVKGSRENVLKDPSGITYAIPVEHVYALLKDSGLSPF
ncbi:S1 family peptidase [Candidatus Nitrosacidococcus tergens]|uniref:Putative Trypsin n=1 Tax=Candidatus Nitrosacidococcus tergens TaxID=553981 RepID=A0A7G1QAL5_9GAMM|nr:serine protease [Candidatus Nitrosacidococcus tergens]CAB1276747.1 putative Trypsin [Candidatus Nitrosacidococcus tergens]